MFDFLKIDFILIVVRLLVLSMALVFPAQAETVEIRTLKTSKRISSAIKTNLDGRKLPADRFEATYDKLVSEKQIDELSRLIKTDVVSESQFKLEANAPPNQWDTIIEGEIYPAYQKPELKSWSNRTRFHIIAAPPAAGATGRRLNPNGTGNPVGYETRSWVSLEYEQWQVLSEMNFGDELIMSLGKIGDAPGNGADAPAEKAMSLVVEGYLVPMRESDAANAERLSAVGTEALVARISSGKEPVDSFRYATLPDISPPSTFRSAPSISKCIDKRPGYKTAGENSLAVGLHATVIPSPDAKWIYLFVGDFVMNLDNPANGSHSDAFEDAIPFGVWKVLPARKHPDGNCTVLFVKVSHLQADQWKPKSSDPPEALPDYGTFDRTYHGIHPSITRKLSQGKGEYETQGFLLKDLLIAHGIPEGSWSVGISADQVMVKNADISVHKHIETLLQEHTWEKVIAEKSRVSR